MIHNIFPTPLFIKHLNLNTKEMASYCLSMQKKDPKGRIHSNKGGWQSYDLDGEHQPLSKLLNDIEHYTNKFCDDIGLISNLKIKNAWVNINGYRDMNDTHNHPGSIISGVYYVKTPKHGGDIVFYHPNYDTFGFAWSDKQVKEDKHKIKYTLHNSARWFVPAEDDKLMLFPSWINHSVEPNKNKKEKRISISFNLS